MAELYEAVLLRAAAVAAARRKTDQAGQEESLHPSSASLTDMPLP